jgi:cation diffusion facilitator CzcD-associated flavoprotein CzcO
VRRRDLCKRIAAGALALGTGTALATLGACAGSRRTATAARVVVIGGGFGGATAAKYVRWFSNYTIDVQLVEPNARFVSTPLSNRVITGDLTLEALCRHHQFLTKPSPFGQTVQISRMRVSS